jgi:hypothetical protein
MKVPRSSRLTKKLDEVCMHAVAYGAACALAEDGLPDRNYGRVRKSLHNELVLLDDLVKALDVYLNPGGSEQFLTDGVVRGALSDVAVAYGAYQDMLQWEVE